MGSDATLINNMTRGSIMRHLIRFALPLILANILQSLYNTVDMIVVGQFVGADGLSAVSIGGEVQHLFLNLCMGFSTGAQILVAQHVGTGDRDGIRRTIGTVFTVVIAASFVFAALGIVLHGWFVDILNTPEEAVEQTKAYVLICCAGMPFIYGYNCVSAVLRGMGDSKRPLLFIAIAAVINLVLDLVFVGIFRMGAAGAAYATVFGQGVSVVISAIYLYKRREAFAFDFKPESFKVDQIKLKSLVRVGLPLALQFSAINLSLLFISANINIYGVTASAVMGVGRKVEQMSNVVIHGLSGAGGTIIGQCLGAGKPDRAKRTVYTALIFAGVICAINITVALVFPRQLFSLFSSDPDVLDMSRMYMRIQCWAYIGAALMGPFGSMITGCGFATLSMIVGLLDGVVARIGLSLLLTEIFGMGIEGYFLGSALARFAGVIVQVIYFYSGKWRTRRLLVERTREPTGEDAALQAD